MSEYNIKTSNMTVFATLLIITVGLWLFSVFFLIRELIQDFVNTALIIFCTLYVISYKVIMKNENTEFKLGSGMRWDDM